MSHTPAHEGIKTEKKGNGHVSESKKHQSKSYSDLSANKIYKQTKETVFDTYNKTTKTLSKAYDGAMTYSSEHPGQTVLIAFAGGLITGLLLANGRRRHESENVLNGMAHFISDLFSRSRQAWR